MFSRDCARKGSGFQPTRGTRASGLYEQCTTGWRFVRMQLPETAGLILSWACRRPAQDRGAQAGPIRLAVLAQSELLSWAPWRRSRVADPAHDYSSSLE